MEDDPRAEQFKGLGHFRGLGEAADAREHGRGIQHPVATGCVLHEELPWQQI